MIVIIHGKEKLTEREKKEFAKVLKRIIRGIAKINRRESEDKLIRVEYQIVFK